MLITIDTNNYTPGDRSLVAQALNLYEVQHVTESAPATETPKPVRKRRTKAEIAADEAAAKRAEEAAQGLGSEDTAGMDDSTDETPQTDQELTDALDAESAAEEQATYADATITEVVELATQLINKDKTLMRGLLDEFGLRKVSDIPEDRMGEMAAKIRGKLAN